MTQTPPDTAPPGRLARARTLLRRLGPVGPVAIISMTLPAVAGILLVTLTVRYEPALKPWVAEHFGLAIALYIVGIAILAGLPILPTYSSSFLAGYLFKFTWGFTASIIGYMGAALVSYAFLRAISGHRVKDVIDENPRWRAVRDELVGQSALRTLLIIALLRLPPNVPFAMTNLVLVSAEVPLRLYTLGTLLGVIPRTAAVVWIAAQASKLSFESGGHGRWMTLTGIALTLVVVFVISHFANRAIRRLGAAGAGTGGFPVEPRP